jgi:hypothetical protein
LWFKNRLSEKVHGTTKFTKDTKADKPSSLARDDVSFGRPIVPADFDGERPAIQSERNARHTRRDDGVAEIARSFCRPDSAGTERKTEI